MGLSFGKHNFFGVTHEEQIRLFFDEIVPFA